LQSTWLAAEKPTQQGKGTHVCRSAWVCISV
jgi:hypothetical protein